MRISSLPLNRQAPCRGLLRFPTAQSEFEVQAFLFVELLNRGYVVRGEVRTFASRARFDIVVFAMESTGSGTRMMPYRIIETKRSHPGKTQCRLQVDGYETRFGVPVDLVCGMKEARAYLLKMESLLPPPSIPYAP